MQLVTSFTPTPGLSKVLNLIYRSGYIEVINDTNYGLYVQISGGNVLQPPGAVQIYPLPVGGGTLVLQTTQQLFYDNLDQGPVNVVTVNQFDPGDTPGMNYPYSLTRTVAQAQQLLPVIATGTIAAISSGLTVTATNPVAVPNAQLYVWGWDLSFDQEGTSHGVTVTVNGCIDGPFVYYYRTQTTVQTDISKRYQQPIAAATALGNISVGFPAVASGTAKASLTVFCLYQ